MSDQQQISIAVASIKVGGTELAFEEETDLDEIVIDTTYNLPAMASIRFYDHGNKWSDSDAFALGDKLTIALAPAKSMDEVSLTEIFAGEVVALEPSADRMGRNNFTIRAYDMSHRLHIGTKSRTFLNMSDSDIVSEIARELGLQAGDVATLPKQKYIIQNNLTDYEFLAQRAKRAGCLFSIVNNKVNFHKPDKMKTGPVLAFNVDEEEVLQELSIRMSAARQAQKINVRGWDFRTKQEIAASNVPEVLWNENALGKAGAAAAKSAFGFNGISNIVTLAPQTKDEATDIAKAASFDQEGHFIEADGVTVGDPTLLAGTQVEIKDIGKNFSGKYYVTRATHVYNNTESYFVHFSVAGRYPQTINQLLNGTPVGAPETGTVHGVVVGLVTNVNDPEGYGRVKVKFPWLAEASAKVESNWARIAAPSAGKTRGFYFLPEVDDEVLVAFEHGNPNYPYIVGMLWNGKDTQPVANTEAHTGEGTVQRMIYSRTGHKIVFDDSNGKKSILIEDATQNQSIFIDSVKNDIVIKGAGNLTIDIKGNIDITAGGNISVTATGNITTDSMNLEMGTKANIKLDSKAMLDMKSVGVASLESTGGMGALKGNSVNIQGTGPVVVMGLPIKLN